MLIVHPAPVPWHFFATFPETVRHSGTDVAGALFISGQGHDVTAHLSTMGMTIVKGR